MKLTVFIYVVCLWYVSPIVQSFTNEYLHPYNCSNQPDYYWRDYDGTIPSDAIAGGLDDGKITYIGQVSDREWILPATIYPCQKKALTNGYGNAFRTQKSVKILCSQFKDRFRWIATSTNEMHLLTDFTLIVGGTELGSALNIGRANFEQRIIIGKVFPSNSPHHGLSIAKRDGKEQTFQSFEILAYEKTAYLHCDTTCDCAIKIQ